MYALYKEMPAGAGISDTRTLAHEKQHVNTPRTSPRTA